MNYKIKKLEWTQFEKSWTSMPIMANGRYILAYSAMSWYANDEWNVQRHGRSIGRVPDKEAAFALAQADFEQIIANCLEHELNTK